MSLLKPVFYVDKFKFKQITTFDSYLDKINLILKFILHTLCINKNCP